MDYGNTKTPCIHPRLGSATQSQVAFPREASPNFPWEKSRLDNTVVKSKKYVEKKKKKGGMCRFLVNLVTRWNVSAYD